MEHSSQLLSQLNDVQRESVVYCDGPSLIVAGAGSGKTRVLTYKIAYLLEQGLKPWSILALTFTNKAAREMKERIRSLVGDEKSGSLQMGTFHSIFSKILRVEASMLNYGSDYTIYDEADSRSLLKKIIKEMGLDDKTYKPSVVHSTISKAKNQLVMADEYVNDHELLMNDARRNMPEIGKIYVNYQQRLVQSNSMDFDDLLVLTFKLLNEHEDIRQKYEQRFEFVLVDEYQDTNYVQQQILWLLTKNKRRLCVVGDDYQSIYAFRGAKIENILSFQRLYEEAKLFKLELNYRSTQVIVNAANSLMEKNQSQIRKTLYSQNEEGERIHVLETVSDRIEAETVCREIRRLHDEENAPWSDFAILYRTNAQSRTFEEEMRKPSVGMGDKYRIYGGLSFYQRKEIKDIVAYFRLVVNPRDEEAFYRVVNYPTRGIGATTLTKLAALSSQTGVGVWELLCHADRVTWPFNKGTLTKLLSFRDLINSFVSKIHTIDALSMAKAIIHDAGIDADLAADKTAEGANHRENVDELVSSIAAFTQAQLEDGEQEHAFLDDYVATVALITDQDNDEASQDKISLMTIHAAKGLEFKNVFVVGMEENMFPSQMALDNPRELDEERRLCYVAITRAEKRCYLSWAHQRWRLGTMDMRVRVSRFINDIDAQYLEQRRSGGGMLSHNADLLDGWNEEPTFNRRPWKNDYESDTPYQGSREWGSDYRRSSPRMQNSRPVGGQFMADPKPKITAPRKPEQAVNPFSASMQQRLSREGNWKKVSSAMSNGGREAPASTHANGNLAEGTVIEHQRFGRGTVVQLIGEGDNAKATIDFDNNGRKQLLLKFARFTIVK